MERRPGSLQPHQERRVHLERQLPCRLLMGISRQQAAARPAPWRAAETLSDFNVGKVGPIELDDLHHLGHAPSMRACLHNISGLGPRTRQAGGQDPHITSCEGTPNPDNRTC